jgi:hypothetical protein
MVLVGKNLRFCTTRTHLAVIAIVVNTNSGTIAAPAKTHPPEVLFAMTDAAQLCLTQRVSARKITCPVKGAGSNLRPRQKTLLFSKISATDTGLPPATSEPRQDHQAGGMAEAES